MPSVMQRVGTPNPRHNLDKEYRKYLDNVDPSLSQHNVVVRQRSVEEIYKEHLQPAFESFNERQKRKDRRLDVKWGCSDALGYQRALDKAAQASNNAIAQKGRPPIREIVWQFGNPEQGFGCLNQTPENREKILGLLLECQTEAEKRYPQLVWGDVVFHADEVTKDAEGKEHGSCHLHSSFVSLCYDNKQGPEVQVAFERCLKEMGFESFEAWKHDLDNIMETVLERHGMERTFMDNSEKHLESSQFHRQQAVIRETKELEKRRDEAKVQTKSKAQELKETAQKVSYRKRDLENLTQELGKTQEKVSALQTEKTSLEGEIERLKAGEAQGRKLVAGYVRTVKEETPKVQALLEQKEGLEKALPELRAQISDARTELQTATAQVDEVKAELPALEAQISDAKEELRVVTAAVKGKKDEGERLMTRDGMAAAIQAERDKRQKEARISLLEQFVQHPSVKPLWENFLRITERNRKPKSRSSQDKDR